MTEIKIRTKGVKKATKNFKMEEAIAEYIWNGFDAGAKTILVNYGFLNDIGRLEYLEVVDDGTGINYNELDEKFAPFLESSKEKRNDNRDQIIKGENGYGRFTFHKFSTSAQWETTFEDSTGKLQTYHISIRSSSLHKYDSSPPQDKGHTVTGTKVRFQPIDEKVIEYFIEETLIPFLRLEFAWFLELYKPRDYKIIVQGKKLDYEDLVVDRERKNIVIESPVAKTGSTFNFEVKYLQWSARLNDEYSKMYCSNSDNDLYFFKTTLLNNKSDKFYHSVYVKSEFFDFFTKGRTDTSNPIKAISKSVYKDVYNDLVEQINRFLREKRRPFLRVKAEKLVEDYEDNGILPEVSSNSWEVFRRKELTDLIKSLYEVEPKIFHQLNQYQKKIFIRFLDLLMDHDSRDDLFEILKETIDLDDTERKRIADILKVTKFSHILETIELIKDRFVVIDRLRELVFNEELNANEVNHLQTFVEEHYWIFGEEYGLVAAAEDKFETALRRFREKVYNKYEDKKIAHPSRLREMDIFLVKQSFTTPEKIDNVVVELKHPKKKLGKKEYDQIKDYMSVISSEPEFNGNSFSWKFYLIGKSYNDYIEGEIENSKLHGERDLAFWNKKNDYKIYVRKWSDVINDITLRHKFLNDKLQLQRNKMSQEFDNVEQLFADLQSNTAKKPGKPGL